MRNSRKAFVQKIREKLNGSVQFLTREGGEVHEHLSKQSLIYLTIVLEGSRNNGITFAEIW